MLDKYNYKHCCWVDNSWAPLFPLPFFNLFSLQIRLGRQARERGRNTVVWLPARKKLLFLLIMWYFTNTNKKIRRSVHLLAGSISRVFCHLSQVLWFLLNVWLSSIAEPVLKNNFTRKWVNLWYGMKELYKVNQLVILICMFLPEIA